MSPGRSWGLPSVLLDPGRTWVQRLQRDGPTRAAPGDGSVPSLQEQDAAVSSGKRAEALPEDTAVPGLGRAPVARRL
ncbi:hypothetical protein GCM10010377_68920 [Streptomyces viridiviolaceus]|nr:hypothetical protein GCM10010377_68920 [Streptomyces viridiviolaceus]